jgi:hypothetical protein
MGARPQERRWARGLQFSGLRTSTKTDGLLQSGTRQRQLRRRQESGSFPPFFIVPCDIFRARRVDIAVFIIEAYANILSYGRLERHEYCRLDRPELAALRACAEQ